MYSLSVRSSEEDEPQNEDASAKFSCFAHRMRWDARQPRRRCRWTSAFELSRPEFADQIDLGWQSTRPVADFENSDWPAANHAVAEAQERSGRILRELDLLQIATAPGEVPMRGEPIGSWPPYLEAGIRPCAPIVWVSKCTTERTGLR